MASIKLPSGHVVLVDDEDYERVAALAWSLAPRKFSLYARHATRKQPTIYMHRFILGINERMCFVDHINGNGLDNRRENLRICTPQQNTANRRNGHLSPHGYKGVWRTKEKWAAKITKDGKSIHLGVFSSPHMAAAVYNAAAISAFGEFAALNALPSANEA